MTIDYEELFETITSRYRGADPLRGRPGKFVPKAYAEVREIWFGT